MSELAIQVSGIGKHYRLGRQESYKSLRDSLASAATAPARMVRRILSSTKRAEPSNRFWALKDVSFDVSPGEVVGVIGRNGAGKSTLLKLLSRITDPSEGRIILRGRVGSLLEVGTGFHPELTGRENIFLNGAILGMKRTEIRKCFDAIVDFAEVEKFLDTPVKHYSSGMYTRLAFSVAAHLDPEILLVDEVLAVGDASFQRKCLNKMESVSRRGRTVFFVSHNMPAITRLCPRAIMMDQGRVYQDGPASQVVSAYLRSGLGTTASREWASLAESPGNEVVRLRAVRVRTEAGQTEESVDIRSALAIEMDYDVLGGERVLVPNLHFFNEDGICLFVAADAAADWRRRPKEKGSYRTSARIPGNFFAEGTIIVRAAISTMDPLIVHVNEPDVLAFQVVDSAEGDSARGDYAGPMPGLIRPVLDWSTTVLTRSS